MRIATIVTLATVGSIKAEGIISNSRDLQTGEMPSSLVTTPLRYYGEFYSIGWAYNLGCGACINAGYTFCF